MLQTVSIENDVLLINKISRENSANFLSSVCSFGVDGAIRPLAAIIDDAISKTT